VHDITKFVEVNKAVGHLGSRRQ